MHKQKLQADDYIVTAYAENAAGPGWANQPVWVIVQGRDGKLRKECLQPSEQPVEMRMFYRMSQEAHSQMSALAGRAFVRERKAVKK